MEKGVVDEEGEKMLEGFGSDAREFAKFVVVPMGDGRGGGQPAAFCTGFVEDLEAGAEGFTLTVGGGGVEEKCVDEDGDTFDEVGVGDVGVESSDVGCLDAMEAARVRLKCWRTSMS